MNESEQAQAIADFRAYLWRAYRWDETPKALAAVSSVLYSQAQKIADQLVEIQKLTEERDKARRITEQYRGHDESNVLPWEKQ